MIHANEELIVFIDTIPDLTQEVTSQSNPSILISNPDDSRIDSYAKKRELPFIVRAESGRQFVKIVNPKKWNGLFFWKKADSIVFFDERLISIKNGNDKFNEKEIHFLQSIK